MTTNMTDLQAQRAELDRQIAAASLPGLQAAQAVLSSQCFDDLNTTIETLGADSRVGRSITGLLGSWSIVRQQVEREITAAEALTAQQETEDASEAPAEAD